MTRENSPCFFFSYARADKSPYLDKFFEELKERVKHRGGYDKGDETSFQDIDALEPGNDWDEKISKALSTCLTLVSIYSPLYFHRPYCGKEFTVFLQRQKNTITYDEDGAARHSKKIIPVLWECKKDLDRKDLPPVVARFIDYNIKEHSELYKNLGLHRILRQKSRGTFYAIVEQIVDVLLDHVEDNPLQPMTEPPKMADVPNAFEQPEPNSNITEMGPNSIMIVYLTAGSLKPSASRANRFDTTHLGDWQPFDQKNHDGLHLSLKEAASKCGFEDFIEPQYDLTKLTNNDQILNDLQEATHRNSIVILVIDPWFIKHSLGRDIFQAVLANENWSGGVMIPVDKQDSKTIQLLPDIEGLWQMTPAQNERFLLSMDEGNLKEFQLEFVRLLTELQKRIAKNSIVPEFLKGRGRTSKPTLRGPTRRQSNGA